MIPFWSPEGLEEKLWKIALEEIRKWELELSDTAKESLGNIIRSGVQRIDRTRKARRSLNLQYDIETAEEMAIGSLRSLIAYMGKEAQERGKHFVIEAATKRPLEDADFFCTFWPFC